MVVCTPVVTQVDKIHICRRVATIKVKECWNHGYSSESMHTGIWWGKSVRVKCVLWVSWCQVVVYLNASPNRRGDTRVWMCTCAAYMMACPKEAVVVWTLTKVIRLEGTVLAWEEQLLFHPKWRGARRERRRPACMMAWPQGNFRWEDMLCWWIWINIGIFLSMLPSNTIAFCKDYNV